MSNSSIGFPLLIVIPTISILFLNWCTSAYNEKYIDTVNQNGNSLVHKLPTGKHFIFEILLQFDSILSGVMTGIFTFLTCWTLSYFNTIAMTDNSQSVLMSPLSRNLLKQTKENRGLIPRIICWSRFGLTTSAPFAFAILVGTLTWYKLNV